MSPTGFNDVGVGMQPDVDHSDVTFIIYVTPHDWEDKSVRCAYLSSFLMNDHIS